MEEKPIAEAAHEEDVHHVTLWEEFKHRMQGAFQVFIGQSAAVNFQHLRQLEFSHSIIQDDLAYTRERDIEKDIEPER